MEKWVRLLPAAGTALVVTVLLVVLFRTEAVGLNWGSATALVFIAAFGFAVAAILRFSIAQLVQPVAVPASTDGDTLLRTRLAPLVIGIGTVGILIVAIAVLIGISNRAGQPAPDASVYLGIFSSVIPVLATWVGTVIAFYFSNESFRQAAEASGALGGDSGANEPITASTRMIPLDKITGIVLKAPKKHPASSSEELKKAPDANDVYPAKAEEVEMRDIVWMLSNATVSRAIIFDPQMNPVMIVRKRLIPEDLAHDARVEQYLARGQNRADAVNFQMVPETATVGEAKRVLDLFKTADLFVTKTGQKGEPIKGWVPDDKLR